MMKEEIKISKNEHFINSSYTKGFRDGHREGYAEGRAAYKADIDLIQIHLQRLEQAVEGIIRKFDGDNYITLDIPEK